MTAAERVTYPSVIAALEAGEGYATNIAEYTGLHVSTVRKILRRYEAEGRAYRWHGNGTASMPDYWVTNATTTRTATRSDRSPPSAR